MTFIKKMEASTIISNKEWLRDRPAATGQLVLSTALPQPIESTVPGLTLKWFDINPGQDISRLADVVAFHNQNVEDPEGNGSYFLYEEMVKRVMSWGDGRIYYLEGADAVLRASLVLTFFHITVGEEDFNLPEFHGCVSYAVVDKTMRQRGLLMELVGKMAAVEHSRCNIKCYFGGLKPIFDNSIPFEMFVRCLDRTTAKKIGFAFDLVATDVAKRFTDARAATTYQKLWFKNPKPSSPLKRVTSDDTTLIRQSHIVINNVEATMRWTPSIPQWIKTVDNTSTWVVGESQKGSRFIDGVFVIHYYHIRVKETINKVGLLAFTTSYSDTVMKAAFWKAFEEGACVLFVPGMRQFDANAAKALKCFTNTITYLSLYNSGVQLDCRHIALPPL